MTAQSIETFAGPAISDNGVIADGDTLSSEVDLKGYLGVLWILNVTSINTNVTCTAAIHEAATTGGSYAVAVQPDGTTNAATTTNILTTVGTYYFRALAENVERFVKLDLNFSATGWDFNVTAVRFGPSVAAKPGVVEGTAGDYQLAIPPMA